MNALLLRAFVVLCLSAFAGCQADEITHYKVPKEPAAREASSEVPFDYVTPEGWKPVPPKRGIEVLAWQGGEGTQIAKTTVSLAGGDLLGNINRWRVQQLGLPAATTEDLQRMTKTLRLGEMPAVLVDFTSNEPTGPKRRILGVITTAGRESWFFKMTGSHEAVEQQKAAFDAFVASLKFDGQGAKP